VFVASKEGEEQRMQGIVAEDPALKSIQPRWLRGGLNEGFRITYRAETANAKPQTLQLAPKAHGLVVVTETEIFGRQRQRRHLPDGSRRRRDGLRDARRSLWQRCRLRSEPGAADVRWRVLLARVLPVRRDGCPDLPAAERLPPHGRALLHGLGLLRWSRQSR
jgi:hypothetical protein